MSETIRKHGWVPDLPSIRDYKYKVPSRITAVPLPEYVLLDHPPIVDQLSLGSCVGNSTACGDYFTQLKQGQKDAFFPSRLFIYYNARAMEGTIKEDSGCQIRDAMQSLAKQGKCPETMWPYDISDFADKPNQKCYDVAAQHQVITYQRLTQELDELKGCLAAGYPFVFGFTVYESFETDAVAKTGIVPMPSREEKVLGGHAVLAVGYDDKTRRFIIQNSWGEKWGDKGLFYMPYAYLTNNDLCDDFWTIRTTENEDEFGPKPPDPPKPEPVKKNWWQEFFDWLF